MFEDIIGNKKETYKLEKNGAIVENAIVDVSNYEKTNQGKIICPDLEIAESDIFMLVKMFAEDTNKTDKYKEYRYSYCSLDQIFVKRVGNEIIFEKVFYV